LAYPNQINEIIAFLVNRIQFAKLSSQFTVKEQLFIQRVLSGMLQAIQKNGSSTTRRVSMASSSLSYSLFIPLLLYFSSENIQIRIILFQLVHFAIKSCRFDDGSDMKSEFFASIRNAIAEWGLATFNQPVDYLMLGTLLVAMSVQTKGDGFAKSVSIVFYLQTKSSSMSSLTLPQKKALYTILLEYFVVVGTVYSCEGLLNYVKELKSERIAQNQWTKNFELKEEFVTDSHSLRFRYSSLLMKVKLRKNRFRSRKS
jgi:hypothetical protein